MNMIIDCFPFFNELDVLEIRLNILHEYVDKFVLVEASKTQSKLDKSFYFEENKERFNKFLDKIVHIKLEDYPNDGGWAMENFQRNCINLGVEKLNLKDDDIIAISDVDEIWDPQKLSQIKNILLYKESVAINMDYFVFFLNLKTVDKDWVGTVFTKFAAYKPITPQHIRNIKDTIGRIYGAGWHFGYQGGKEVVYNKYLSCIEPINKSLLPSKEIFFKEFDERIKDNGSFIFSDNLSNQSIKLEKINMFEFKNFPKYLIDNQKKYQKMYL